MAEKVDKFEAFLIEEYSNVAQAHFKSIETITTFFRYYLLIMSVAISVIALVSQFAPDANKHRFLKTFLQQEWPVPTILFCISLVGLGMFCYIVNLRLDVILYARVVNGIRKFFYDDSEVDINFKLRMRALPQSPQLPSYSEKSFFLPVVIVFGVINTLYSSVAYYLYFSSYHISFEWYLFYIAIFFVFHLLIYKGYSEHREIGYLKSNILGIDIDGVLNKHREQFCSLLHEKTKKEIRPNEITIMPVHEHPKLGIDRDDERKVFNDPKYWLDMPIIEGAVNNIKKLRNIFKLKIFIFTSRPWPEDENRTHLYALIEGFLKRCGGFSIKIAILDIILSIPILKKISIQLKEQPLWRITKVWLKKHGLKYDKFIFEKGNDYSSDPRGDFRNRFYIARKKKIRFFVEDDFEKAIKLSYICEVVFLYSHPYNKPQPDLPTEENRIRKELPSNIIRIDTWDEIYQYIRRLS